MITIIGWDVGGANTKAAWLAYEHGEAREVRIASSPYEIWRDKARLPAVLRETLAAVTSTPPDAMALTMTAELADVFQSKREGVLFVLESIGATFPELPIYALSLEGEFVALAEARSHLLDFAATNWVATARFVAKEYPTCLLVDVGSTTTDIIPIVAGQVGSQARTDLDRLLAGELVYTGALRTHLAAIVQRVPVRGQLCPVSPEYFSIIGDVHLILGHIQPDDYTCPTPDGRPATVEYAQKRLARLVCADLDLLGPAEIEGMARYIHQQQIRQIEEGVLQVLSHEPGYQDLPLLAMGSGAFLAVEVGHRLGLTVLELATRWGQPASTVAPCLAAAHLLAERLDTQSSLKR